MEFLVIWRVAQPQKHVRMDTEDTKAESCAYVSVWEWVQIQPLAHIIHASPPQITVKAAVAA